ncbi:MAG: caspase family protein, partial [Candidatus Saccharimonadales bacterium]
SGFNQYGAVERSFDAQALAIAGAANADDWLPAGWARGNWTARREADGKLQLFQANQPRAYVLIADEAIRCYCWLPGADGQPAAVAVGTDVHNDIYLCRLTVKGACPILRRFRGHADFVTSLGASRDGRYLASGSADGTIRLWSLSNYLAGRAPAGRWGAELAVQGEQLTVTRLDPAGPLFFKGVREGDMLRSIAWFDERAGEVRQERPAEMLGTLNNISWQTQVLFRFSRGDDDRSPFQLLPAWQPLAQLFVSDQDEWAYWTPEGYYDASANGHTLFGWQVNRGLLAAPDFFRADQFRKNLERPDVMERLLSTGSLNAALLQARVEPPRQPDLLVAEQIEATQRISIMTPRMGDSVDKTSATVRALIELPKQGELVQAKAFANGVVAAERRLVEQREVDGRLQLLYEWRAGLPAEARVMIQIVAGTKANTVALDSVFIERPKAEQAARPPRLYVLSVGVDQYRDPAIQPLRYAVADARSIVDLMRAKAPGLYDLAATTLQTNEQVTRQQWQTTFAEMSQRLKGDAQPDDLFLIFMAGHGLVDPEERQYYFASYDLSADEVLRGVYTGSISWRDFELLADVPCRKLAFLDTCHSGAIQPLRTRDLKAAIRALQEDVVLTVAASAGNERSEEKPAWQHGAFTKTLLEGLEGDADA